MSNFIIGVFAVWRITSLLAADHHESGPGDILHRFRDKLGIHYTPDSEPYADNVIGKLFCCFWCLSLWIALPVALYIHYNIAQYSNFILWTLALSGGAITIDRISS